MSRTGNFFIIMRTDLAETPEVIAMAAELKVRKEVIVGYLHSVWSWVSQHCPGQSVEHVTLQGLACSLNLEGFPQMMERYGWLKEYRRDDGTPVLVIPNYDRWFGGKELRRQHERDRKRKQRGNVPEMSRTNAGQRVGQLAPTETETETETETSKKESKPKKRFVVPSVDDVRSYVTSRSSTVDPQRFVDYYEANGWRVGRNPMKDWKAAVRTWERNGHSPAMGSEAAAVDQAEREKQARKQRHAEVVAERKRKRGEL